MKERITQGRRAAFGIAIVSTGLVLIMTACGQQTEQTAPTAIPVASAEPAVGAATGEKGEGYAFAEITEGTVAQLPEKVSTVTVTIDSASLRTAPGTIAAAKDRMRGLVAKRGGTPSRALSGRGRNSREVGGTEYGINDDYDHSDLEIATYEDSVDAISADDKVGQSATEDAIQASFDDEGMSAAIANGLAGINVDQFNPDDSAQVKALQDAVQASLDAYSGTLAKQALAVAENNADIAAEDATGAINNPSDSTADVARGYMTRSYEQKLAADGSPAMTTPAV